MCGRIFFLVRAATSRARLPQPARNYYGGNIAGPKKLDSWGKRIMVFGGAFKNVAEVPEVVPHAQYLKCREKTRIKLNIAAIFVTLGACYYMMTLGQKDSEAGLSIHNKVLEKHADLKKAAGNSSE